ncbi:DUF4011 domain-containing protein [Parvularcula marina]|uniref:DUF4011 domain-containing protein n=1 Tax=Parvularcula marina TaxID=2292771 RepID=UPI0035157CAB
MAEAATPPEEESLDDWVKERIERLRPRLLDLTRKNPLISTTLTPRSTSYIRVVDELPDVLEFALKNQEEMRFDPLPPLETDPPDEDTEEFLGALAEARVTDDVYLADLEGISDHDIDSEEKIRIAERALKDRVREKLEMPPRQTTGDISLVQHAKLHNVSPNYDLPSPDEEHEDGRHTDDAIQTLLLPDQLERKLNSLISKCNSWIQETGINVLHAAFGYLEWRPKNEQKSSMAPLVLTPVAIEKRKTPEGPEYWVKGLGEPCETNLVLAEMLKTDHAVDLPPFQGGSVEEYLAEIAELKPRNVEWRVRRQVVFGVFPSARMAMYHDLDPSKNPHFSAPIVQQLLGGIEASVGASPFGDEYDVEAPEIEQKVPCLITEADSSQLSVLVDLADNKSLAVEGPPGTGKSQTIVNAIAAAISSGKTVLFVAEKSAALEVVKARLESLGLGEFLLPLLAEKSSRQQVISALRDRMAMETPRAPQEIESKIEEYRQVRSDLNSYVDIVSQPFGETGLTVYDVLGKAVKANEILRNQPDIFTNAPVSEPSRLSAVTLNQISEAAKSIDQAIEDRSECRHHWAGIKPQRADSIELDQILRLSNDVADAFERTKEYRAKLENFEINRETPLRELFSLTSLLNDIKNKYPDFSRPYLKKIQELDTPTDLAQFVSDCLTYQGAAHEVSQSLTTPVDESLRREIGELISCCEKTETSTLDTDDILAGLDEIEDEIFSLTQMQEVLEPVLDQHPELADTPFSRLCIAGKYAKKAGRDSLLLRNEKNTAPEALSQLRYRSQLGRTLQSEKADIELIANIPDEDDGSLRRMADILESAGVFSFLSGAYRQAKKRLRTISKKKSISTHDGAKLLRRIMDWKSGYKTLIEGTISDELFGLNYRRIDTDFENFDNLATYLQHIDQAFGAASSRPIRNFLLSGDRELVWGLTFLEDHSDLKYTSDLAPRLNQKEGRRDLLKASADLMRMVAKKFNRPEVVTLKHLRSLLEQLSFMHEKGPQLDKYQPGCDFFGDDFRGADTNVRSAGIAFSVFGLAQQTENHQRAVITSLIDGTEADLHHLIGAIHETTKQAETLVASLNERSGKDFSEVIRNYQPSVISSFFRDAAADEIGIRCYSRLYTAYQRLTAFGLGWVPQDLSHTTQKLADILPASIYRAMAGHLMTEHGHLLNKFPGTDLNAKRMKLATLDKQILSLSRRLLRAQAAVSADPPTGNGRGRKSTWSELSLIENEVGKQKRFISVRDLTSRAGRALQELKPCWMMSPLAVAQYLPAHKLRFDLCIIDEASQMKPEDAIGALARCGQAIVVGDVNQLPPSNFFQKMVADDDEDDDGATVEQESILEIANAKLRPARRLKWHYRSQHSNLIRFSNELVYDDSLVIFPSSDEERPDMGIKLIPVKGRYRTGVNPIEAKTIVDAVLQFMRSHPERSLGVVTLNKKQRDLIEEEFNHALDRDEVAAQYVEDWNTREDGLEKFFIKNLENVQGDERDVIFIGTVYGPEKDGGPVAQRFGPINGVAGKRRLNVLFSRAKKQIVTFSSMRASDIRATEDGNPGSYMLKRWLEYSASGVLETADHIHAETDSDFEDFVIQQLKAMGCEPVPQVGARGYRIDIGVKHPEWPYGFILGVECDGATYHSCKSARDRDRLRQEVLERLGWRFHRIWSTDWFNDPRAETERLRQVIQDRLAELKAKHPERVSEQPDVAGRHSTGTDKLAIDMEFGSDETPVATQEDDDAPTQRTFFQPGVSSDAAASAGRLLSDAAVEVGDTVRVSYVGQPAKSLQFTITPEATDPDNGMIAEHEPIAQAVLGAEEGDEIEVLIGSYVKKGVIEAVRKVRHRPTA